MDLEVALKKASDDEHDDENDTDEVYAGKTLRGEETSGFPKIRYASGRKESKKFSRYGCSLRNMIPIRPSKKSSAHTTKIDQSGLFSFVTYSWIFPYLWAAFKGRLSQDQTWNCSIYDSSTVNMARLEYLWNQEIERNSNRPSLFRVICKFIKTRIIVASIVFLFCLIFGFIGPTCFVRGLVAFAENPPRDGNELNLKLGLFLVFSILFVEFARVLSYGATWAISYRTGIRVRGALLALLYKKLVNVRSLRKKTAAEIVNVYANDGQRLFDAVTFAPLVLVGPLVLIGGIIHLLCVIGPWSLLGILTFLLFDVLQFGLGKTMVRFRASAIAKTEQRISLMGEIIRCIRVIKMNAWEETFIRKIEEMRHSEKVDLRTAGYAQSLAIASGPVVPVVAAIFTFLGVVLSGNDLLASDAFSAITVFFVMLFGIRMIPYGSRYCAEAIVALRRIQELLLYPEYDIHIPPAQDPSIAIQFKNASFTWDDKDQTTPSASEATERSPVVEGEQTSASSPFTLEEIDLTIKKKELIAVCGPVGSGKTALLNAIVGHMAQKEGSLNVSGSVAYVTQSPWIQNLTVQGNILFGLPMNTSRYYRAITACELSKDLETMKAADQTEIGERGVTLSGGQKARVALARALFANRQIYLLDNALSSVDRNVGDRIFQHAIKEMLGNKTVVMVTTDIQRLSRCDRVIYMESGRVIGFAPHEELLEKYEQYALFCENAVLNDPSESELQTPEMKKSDEDDFVKVDNEGKEATVRRATASSMNDLQASSPNSLMDLPSSADGQIVEEEENLGLAAMSWSVYKQYINAAGSYLIWIVLLLAFVLNVFATIFSTAWLSQWLKHGHVEQLVNESGELMVVTESLAKSNSTAYYATVYGLSLILLFGTGFLKAVIFVKVSLNAASRLHSRMFKSVIRATVQFFDITPSGRILNRFTKDMDEIDVKLPFTVEIFLQNMITCIGFLIMIAWVFPAFLIACVPLSCIFALFVVCFRAGITSLKRSENISRSPLFEQISASMEGLHIIHSFDQTEHFIDILKVNLDSNSGAMFMYQSAMRWLAVWLDLLVVAITFVVALLIVLLTGSVAPADAGMALAFAIQMSGIFQFAVRTQTELEAKMTSVERVAHYCEHIEPEGEWEAKKEDPPVPSDWPAHGDIEFKDVKLRYRPSLPLALDGVTFSVASKDKVGIIGRTGSGKSSLCNVLYRMYPLTWGTISIDGVNIAHIGLHRLRRSMAVIPQDPTLFAGTIRFNLDPNQEFTDDQLWNALERTFLKDMVSSLENKLEATVTEGGRNLSVGERQLMCMARAILRRVRIVVLDEATGSLDVSMDRLVQKCLKEALADCTVFMIAHRLENVLSMNKLLYMNQAKLIEYDDTKKILAERDSHIRRLVNGEMQRGDDSGTAGSSKQEKGSSDNSDNSSPVHLYPVLETGASGKTSPETSEFEKISESVGKGTNSAENSDLEVIENKSEIED
uniref:Multidrug resistance-associated protein 5 n=1 Tax=Ascaris suum TaxID=6253 RepID=F1KQ57_ASCSU